MQYALYQARRIAMDFEQVCGVRVCFKKLNVIIRVTWE